MEYTIRKNAMILLAHLYQNCNSLFMVNNLNIEELNLTHDQKWQSSLYLQRMKYISVPVGMDKKFNTITCEIYVDGINAVENYFGEK